MNIVHVCALEYHFVLKKAQTNELIIHNRQMKISQDVLAKKLPKREEIHCILRKTNCHIRRIGHLNQEVIISNGFNSSRNESTYM